MCTLHVYTWIAVGCLRYYYSVHSIELLYTWLGLDSGEEYGGISDPGIEIRGTFYVNTGSHFRDN